MDKKAERILSTGGAITAALLTLLGGLALVVRALRKADLGLHLRVGDGGEKNGRTVH